MRPRRGNETSRQPADPAPRPGDRGPRVVVLVEGASDVAAVRSLAATMRIDCTHARLVDLHGVTNVRRVLSELVRRPQAPVVVGMCDAGEVRFVHEALRATGRHVRDEEELASCGFFVCHTDVEDELIRALGADRALHVIDRLGLASKLATLQQQPAWRGRPLIEQIHRFCGVASGRKRLLAGELASAVGPDEVPAPLLGLLERISYHQENGSWPVGD